jgi:hypothetical protein
MAGLVPVIHAFLPVCGVWGEDVGAHGSSPWAEGPRDMCGWPPARKEFCACRHLKVTCGHVSGLLARQQAAGPDGFRGSRPDQARGVALPHDP